MNLLVVEINRSSIVAARFRVAKTLSFERAQSHSAADGDISSLLRDMQFQDNDSSTIVLAVDPALFSYREMELTISDRRKIREILPLELKGETIIDTSELTFDSIPMEKGKILAIWGKPTDISIHITSMVKLGVEPAIVTSAPFHWQSLLPQESVGPVALSDGTALAVYSNRTLVYFRALGNAGAYDEIAATVTALELSKGIIIREIFVFGAAAPAPSPEVKTHLVFSPLPVSATHSAGFDHDEDSARQWAGMWALATDVSSGASVNFRYGDLAYTAGAQKLKKKLMGSAVLASLLFVALFAEAGIRYYLVKKDLDSVNASIATIYHGIFPARKKAIDEVAEVKSEIKRMGGDTGAQIVLKIMRKLAEIKGTGVTGFYESEFEGNQVRLKGDADSFQAVNDFKMRTAGFLTTAEASDIKSRAGGGVTFSFRGTAQEGVR